MSFFSNLQYRRKIVLQYSLATFFYIWFLSQTTKMTIHGKPFLELTIEFPDSSEALLKNFQISCMKRRNFYFLWKNDNNYSHYCSQFSQFCTQFSQLSTQLFDSSFIFCHRGRRDRSIDQSELAETITLSFCSQFFQLSTQLFEIKGQLKL